MKKKPIDTNVGAGVFAAIFLTMTINLLTTGCNTAQQNAKVEEKELRIPRVSKPWSEALRLVGDGNPLYSDFTLIKDKLDRWHCIGTFGKGPDSYGSGYVLSDGYALFHAVGNSLEAPMTLQDKIPYQIASPQAYMWAPAAIWNRDRTTAFLFYFHYLGSSEFKENCVRLLTSNASRSYGLAPLWRNASGGKEHGLPPARRSRLLRFLG
jgi:hypothetical protein